LPPLVLNLMKHLPQPLAIAGILCWLGTADPTTAQISGDNSAGTLVNGSLTSTCNAGTCTITGGSTNAAGNTLFHSFSQFSIPTGPNQAVFANSASIQNIISRVTGGSISNIDGAISTSNPTNLFLINPSGIIFGANARLNIGGSFIASTADSLRFSDGAEFSAVNAEAPPLLTIGTPLGLQYGSNPGSITVRGNGNFLFSNRSFNSSDPSINRDLRNGGFDPPGPTPALPPFGLGLQVGTGQTIALLGGNISLNGGNLTAQGGNIEVGSVSGGSFVNLSPSSLGFAASYSGVSSFGDISLSEASLEASGLAGGTIQVQGRRVTLSNGSAMLADTLGNGSGGTLTIRATESITASGTTTLPSGFPPIEFSSRISADAVPGSTGNGGTVNIETGTLQLADGAQVSVGAFSSGSAGTLNASTQAVTVDGGSSFGPSGLFVNVQPGSTGSGGILNLTTGSLRVTGGAQIAANTFGAGNAGILNVIATDLELNGTIVVPNAGEFPSALLANVERGATGNGGSLNVEVNRLRLLNGGQISASTFGSGNAGQISIQATTTELTGSGTAFPSSIFTTVELGATGQGGNLLLETNTLNVTNGAQIGTGTRGPGNGGTLTVTATNIDLSGSTALGASGLFSSAIIGTGAGGNTNITTDSLTIREGATISSSNFSSGNPTIPPGQGRAGDIQVQANSILLDSSDASNPSSITASTFSGGGGNISFQVSGTMTANNSSRVTSEARGSGDGGSITANVGSLFLTNGAFFSTSTISSGDAGTVRINSTNPNSVTFQGMGSGRPSGAFSESLSGASGNAGSVVITTPGNLSLLDGARISTNSVGTGQTGNITLAAGRQIFLDNSQITATSLQTGGGNISLVTPLLLMRNGSLISTSVLDSTGGGGNIVFNGDFIVAVPGENSDITANAVFGPGGNITVTATELFGIRFRPQLTPLNDITVSSQFGLNGTAIINTDFVDRTQGLAKLTEGAIDTSELIVAGCSAVEGNVFVVTGRGGLPVNPDRALPGETLWSDFRDLSGQSQRANAREVEQTSDRIVEAQGWIVNGKGNLELVARLPAVTPESTWRQSIPCGNRGEFRVQGSGL